MKHGLVRQPKMPAATPAPSIARAPGRLLQRKCACGGTVVAGGECAECRNKRLQTKLTVNQPGDRFEQEADRMADFVVRGGKQASMLSNYSLGGLQRDEPKTPGEKKDDKDSVASAVLMRKAPNESNAVAAPIVNDVLAQTGQPLDRATRSFMEARFGYDFSRVRVHSDARANASARRVRAHAYTVGENIVFDSGRFAPQTREGRQLVAHELTHVVQQGATGGVLQRKVNLDDFEGGKFDNKTLETYLTNHGPGKKEDHDDSDDKARTIVALWRKGQVTFPPEKKILLIQEMQSGFTGDDDERAILTLLVNSSDADLQIIFNPKNGIDPKDLDTDFQGPEEDELRGFYDRKFEGGRAAALKGSRALKVAQKAPAAGEAGKKKEEAPPRPPRKGEKDVVVLLDPTLAPAATTVAPEATTLKPSSPEDLGKQLKAIKHPIKRILFFGHADDGANIKFGKNWVPPVKLSKAVEGTVPEGFEPDLADFRGCRVGMSPPGMEQIRAALRARAAVGATCWLVTKIGGPFNLGEGFITSQKQAELVYKKKADAKVMEGLALLIKSFDKSARCIIDRTPAAYFRTQGKLVAAWFAPIRSGEFDPLYSKCYSEVTPETVDPVKVLKGSSGISHECHLLRVEEPPVKK